MQESSRGADHGSDLCLHVSLYAGNCLKHVCTLLIGYRSGGTPGFPQNLRARDGIAGHRRGSSACQRPGDLPTLRVTRRCSPVGFDRQQTAHLLAGFIQRTPSVLEYKIFWIQNLSSNIRYYGLRMDPIILIVHRF